MTDTEIKKALEEYINFADLEYTNHTSIEVDILKNALDLINRQKADIKKLTSGKCIYLSDDETTEYCVEGPCPNYKTVGEIKSEAYEEFANELKCRTHEISCNTLQVVTEYDIDNLLNELVGENDA